MAEAQLRQRPGDYLCGLARWHPAWMQRYATTKSFMLVYGLLGTIQAMSYMYFVVTLTTIEKRFKIPSQTTGIILSGNEISQILLSLILSYIGGQRNRPRWIAWGIVFCGLSCYILALPHFIYGAGDGALHLTAEYLQEQSSSNSTLNMTSSFSLVNASIRSSQELCGLMKSSQECESFLSIVPLVLIFLSQFVLGVGNTLYYSLGQTYLDDNTKERNTPLMLAVAMALRMIGPIVGFFLGYISLNMYIDPFKKPLIDNKDPRWLGAWWFGWMILGTLMVLFSGLIGLFPKQLPKKKSEHYNSHLPRMMRLEQLKKEDGISLGSTLSLTAALDANAAAAVDADDFPKLKDFPKALLRLLRNKLLIYNIISGVFYILGAAGYMTFLSKYMEVQFHRTAQTATVVVGPISIIGMVIGLIGSGIVISKKHPSPSKVLMWNVIVGCVYILGQTSYIFMYCGDSISLQNGGNYNFTNQCNKNCSCDNVAYSPVCHEASDTTFFSACHAGCKTWDAKEKTFSNCSCIDVFDPVFTSTVPYTSTTPSFLSDLSTKQQQPLAQESLQIINGISTTGMPIPIPTTILNNDDITASTTARIWTTTPKLTTTADELLTRASRSVSTLSDILTPGVCLKGCSVAFYSFTIASMVVNWFGSSGRIGNLLVNFRAVATKDKSFAQGLSLMMISLLALIPGPIIFGRIIDSTCLVWTETCHGRGNCQLYDQTKFRYYVNILSLSLTSIGVIFDILVWYHGRHLDLYGEREEQKLKETRQRDKPITPLLAHSS